MQTLPDWGEERDVSGYNMGRAKAGRQGYELSKTGPL